MSPRGRRPAGSDTREQILGAARQAFAQQGYTAASIRGIAREAGVDPALVHHYFGGKAGLFAATQDVPVNPAEVLGQVVEGDPDGAGERLVRLFLQVWDSPDGRLRLVGLLTAAATHEDAARTLREFLSREVFGRVVVALDSDHPEERGALVASQLVGLAMARYVVRLPPLADAEPADVVRWVAPTIQLYLTGPLSW